jgi:hypothetical protein
VTRYSPELMRAIVAYAVACVALAEVARTCRDCSQQTDERARTTPRDPDEELTERMRWPRMTAH